MYIHHLDVKQRPVARDPERERCRLLMTSCRFAAYLSVYKTCITYTDLRLWHADTV